MSNLRRKMTKIKDHSKMDSIQRSEEFDRIISEMGMEISNLNKTIMDSRKSYDRVGVMERMEEAKDIMQELESRIKFDNNGTPR